MDVLVTGGAGQVGIELLRADWPAGTALHAPERAELDLADPASIERVLSARPFDAIVSCGAYTAVDKAEEDVVAAWRVNALAPALLAKLSAAAGIPLVHVSTDYVFPGSKDGYYREDDPVGPLGVYGASKEGGEQAVRTGNPRHAIVRTAWVVSPHRANFVKTMLRVAGTRDELGVVDDQRGCPTFAGDLAAALATVTGALVRDRDAPTGTFHFVNGGEASWADLAEAVFARSAARGGPTARVKRIRTVDYPTPAKRPANSRLATDRLRDAFGIVPRPWPDALDETIAVLV